MIDRGCEGGKRFRTETGPIADSDEDWRANKGKNPTEAFFQINLFLVFMFKVNCCKALIASREKVKDKRKIAWSDFGDLQPADENQIHLLAFSFPFLIHR